MKLTRIFLDMDDVCCALSPHLVNVKGHPREAVTYQNYPRGFGYDIRAAVNHFLGANFYRSRDSFWSSIARDVWAQTPETEEFQVLFDECRMHVGDSGICLATIPVEHTSCLAGKLDWIFHHLPSWMWKQYMIGNQKYLLASPGSLLIDDNDDNVKHWRQAGGQAILFPRPWNALYEIKNPLAYVRYALRQAFENGGKE